MTLTEAGTVILEIGNELAEQCKPGAVFIIKNELVRE